MSHLISQSTAAYFAKQAYRVRLHHSRVITKAKAQGDVELKLTYHAAGTADYLDEIGKGRPVYTVEYKQTAKDGRVVSRCRFVRVAKSWW